MATIANSAVKSTIIEETVLGTRPTTGNRYELPRKTGSSFFAASNNEVTSDTIRPGLNANGSRSGPQSVSGTIEMNAFNADVVDLLVSCAAGGKFVSNTLKASDAVYSFTRVDELGTGKFDVFTGNVVNSFQLTTEALGLAQYSFGCVGLKQETLSTVPGTYTAQAVPNDALEIMGSELKNLTADGDTSLVYSSLALSIESPRNPRYGIGIKNADGFSSTTRAVTLTLTFFRDPAKDYGTIFNGDLKAYSFEVGLRRYTVYGNASKPTTQNGDDIMYQVVITAGLNATEGTGLKVEKIVAP